MESFNDSQVPSNTPTPSKDKATPMLSNEKVPTTVHQLIDTIKQYKRGKLWMDEEFLRFRIDKRQYHDLVILLDKDEFCLDKLRYDYFPLQRLFVIRAYHSRAHERFLSKVHYEISRQLRNVVESPLSKFAKTIEHLGRSRFIPSDPEFGRHGPDASFGHAGEQFPGLVIEVAYSQEGKTLEELAEDYILGSDLGVRVLAAFDDPSKKKEKTAKFTVWRPRLLQEDHGEVWTISCEEQVFRDDSGEPNLDPDSGLRLHLRDFASDKFCEQFGNIEGTIFVSCATLCNFWNDVESTENQPTVTENPVLRTLCDTPTPEEKLDTDDERDFVEKEQRATMRAARDDSSFKASSSEQS